MNAKIYLRNDTKANWSVKNPILAQGEIGIEIDSRNLKIGDGNTYWNNLPYVIEDTSDYIKTGTYARLSGIILTEYPENSLSAVTRNFVETLLSRALENISNPTRYIIDTFSDETSWYIKYNDGWIEQGGRIPLDGRVPKDITFTTPFTSIPTITTSVATANRGIYGERIDTVTSTGFNAYADTPGKYTLNYIACGK